MKHLTALLALLVLLFSPLARSAPEHELLKQAIGTWTADIEFFDPASGKVTGTAKGLMRSQFVAGETWVVDDFKVFDTNYGGHGIWGWDAQKQKYVGVWADPNLSYIRSEEGSYDAATRRMDWRLQMPDASGKPIDWSFVVEFNGDERTFSSYYFSPKDGSRRQTIRITFHRQKHPD